MIELLYPMLVALETLLDHDRVSLCWYPPIQVFSMKANLGLNFVRNHPNFERRCSLMNVFPANGGRVG